eukprot:2195063-Rhodomonas_salina.1
MHAQGFYGVFSQGLCSSAALPASSCHCGPAQNGLPLFLAFLTYDSFQNPSPPRAATAGKTVYLFSLPSSPTTPSKTPSPPRAATAGKTVYLFSSPSSPTTPSKNPSPPRAATAGKTVYPSYLPSSPTTPSKTPSPP